MLPKIANKKILEIAPYVPGESKSALARTIKLSANENPFGASRKAVQAAQEALENAHLYPDGGSEKLKEALCKHFNLKRGQVVCGNGSGELIALITQAYAGAGDEVLYTEHAFLLYPISAYRAGATPIKVKEKNLKADTAALLAAVNEKTKMVFLANPNNPTGSYLTWQELQDFRHRLPSHILLVVDDAYAEYATQADYSPAFPLVDLGNTVVSRTFSKIYGLAALRIGFMYCPPEMADMMERTREPFNVSSIAQAAGIAALEDKAFLENSVHHNEKARAFLSQEISSLGLTTYPSAANFILVRFDTSEKKSANAAFNFLKERGIILRQMKSYGLPECLRITVGRDEDNAALLKLLKEFLK